MHTRATNAYDKTKRMPFSANRLGGSKPVACALSSAQKGPDTSQPRRRMMCRDLPHFGDASRLASTDPPSNGSGRPSPGPHHCVDVT